MNYYRTGQTTRRRAAVAKNRPKPRGIFSRTIDFLIFAGVAGGIIFSLMVKADPKVSADSSVYHSTSTYYEAVLPSFKSLGNRNKLTFDERGIVSELKQRYPEINTATISLPIFGQTPELKIQIAKPAFILNSGSGDYIINSKGTAVSKKQDLPAAKDLPVVRDQSGLAVSVGEQVLAGSEVRFIGDVIRECRRAKVQLAAMTLPPRPLELEVRTADTNYLVKFHLGTDSAVQIGQFLAARDEFERSGKQPAEYLDVRVPGKIYFK